VKAMHSLPYDCSSNVNNRPGTSVSAMISVTDFSCWEVITQIIDTEQLNYLFHSSFCQNVITN
jgi:hypothetical protein